MALTDDAGALVEKTWYEAYGNSTCRRESDGQEQAKSFFDNPYLFQGRRWCDESNLYYFRNRYMSPTLGRFMQRDPFGYVDSLNLYQSFLSSPPYFSDPRGKGCLVFYKCKHGRRIDKFHCEYYCLEDKSKPRQLRAGGAGGFCDDPRIPKSIHEVRCVCWPFRCKDYDTSKLWGEWAQIKDCSKRECKKEAKRIYDREVKGCDFLILSKAKKWCKRAAKLAYYAACEICNLCQRP